MDLRWFVGLVKLVDRFFWLCRLKGGEMVKNKISVLLCIRSRCNPVLGSDSSSFKPMIVD